jgi:hypothetical protein
VDTVQYFDGGIEDGEQIYLVYLTDNGTSLAWDGGAAGAAVGAVGDIANIFDTTTYQAGLPNSRWWSVLLQYVGHDITSWNSGPPDFLYLTDPIIGTYNDPDAIPTQACTYGTNVCVQNGSGTDWFRSTEADKVYSQKGLSKEDLILFILPPGLSGPLSGGGQHYLSQGQHIYAWIINPGTQGDQSFTVSVR